MNMRLWRRWLVRFVAGCLCMLGASVALADGYVDWPDDTKVIDVSASQGIIYVVGQDEDDALYTLAVPESLARSLKVQAMPKGKGPVIAMKGFFDWPSDTKIIGAAADAGVLFVVGIEGDNALYIVRITEDKMDHR